ncbi:hypothetical protein [Lampropedia aestuarii]|uniref:hypothetical protein n=1 Tax=Lampropedia aestuarii TaxID=2562762 RepID=UPI002468587C|nr:hypothetical protein [Lampropedia aestuarii]MDH5859283.1 hypothetical protein [Lampropedia aestuarii]
MGVISKMKCACPVCGEKVFTNLQKEWLAKNEDHMLYCISCDSKIGANGFFALVFVLFSGIPVFLLFIYFFIIFQGVGEVLFFMVSVIFVFLLYVFILFFYYFLIRLRETL